MTRRIASTCALILLWLLAGAAGAGPPCSEPAPYPPVALVTGMVVTATIHVCATVDVAPGKQVELWVRGAEAVRTVFEAGSLGGGCPWDAVPLGSDWATRVLTWELIWDGMPVIDTRWTLGGVEFSPSLLNNTCVVYFAVAPTVFVPLTMEEKARFETASGWFQAAAVALIGIGVQYPKAEVYTKPLAVLAQALQVFLHQVALHDPPDPNYQEVVLVVQEPYTPLLAPCETLDMLWKCILTPKEKRMLNALMDNEAWMIGLLRAILTTVDRGTTAAVAGDGVALARQQGAFTAYVAQLKQRLADESTLRQAAAQPFLTHGRAVSPFVAAALVEPGLLAALEAASQ